MLPTGLALGGKEYLTSGPGMLLSKRHRVWVCIHSQQDPQNLVSTPATSNPRLPPRVHHLALPQTRRGPNLDSESRGSPCQSGSQGSRSPQVCFLQVSPTSPSTKQVLTRMCRAKKPDDGMLLGHPQCAEQPGSQGRRTQQRQEKTLLSPILIATNQHNHHAPRGKKQMRRSESLSCYGENRSLVLTGWGQCRRNDAVGAGGWEGLAGTEAQRPGPSGDARCRCPFN